MTTTIWLAIELALLSFPGYRAMIVWLGTGQREIQPAHNIVWTLTGALLPDRYWWEARNEQMSAQEKQDLLTRITSAPGPSSAESLHCPLGGTEVPRAWTLAAGGQSAVAPGSRQPGHGPPPERSRLRASPRPDARRRQLLATRFLPGLHARAQAPEARRAALAPCPPYRAPAATDPAQGLGNRRP